MAWNGQIHYIMDYFGNIWNKILNPVKFDQIL